MIPADAGKNCADRILDDVRCIQFTAKPRFQHHQIAFHFLKIQKSYCRLCLKDRREILSRSLKPGNSVSYSLCQFSEFLF